MSERFEALGNYVYEKGERIGATPEESAINLARKLNAYQMRIERLKEETRRLRKAGNNLHGFLINYIVDNRLSSAYLDKLDNEWLNAAKNGNLTN